jgi:cytochrome b pre-mRNA-processing protein 3
MRRREISMLNLLKDFAARKRHATHLYDGLVSRSREPVFYAQLGVADSLDGRFDMLVFHAWLVLKELKGSDLAQELTNQIFTGFDEAMREQGAGDMGIGHKLKAMANAFYGRLSAYDRARNEEELAASLAKNLWRGGATDARALTLAGYAASARQSLVRSLPDALDFGPLPTI